MKEKENKKTCDEWLAGPNDGVAGWNAIESRAHLQPQLRLSLNKNRRDWVERQGPGQSLNHAKMD